MSVPYLDSAMISGKLKSIYHHN